MTNEQAKAEIMQIYGVLSPSKQQALDMAIKALEQEPNTWSLDDAREDFMSDVYNTLDFLPTNEEANRIIDSFDRVTSNIEQEPKMGHWKRISIDLYVQHATAYYKCSECGEKVIGEHNYCQFCGARMESEDDK